MIRPSKHLFIMSLPMFLLGVMLIPLGADTMGGVCLGLGSGWAIVAWLLNGYHIKEG